MSTSNKQIVTAVTTVSGVRQLHEVDAVTKKDKDTPQRQDVRPGVNGAFPTSWKSVYPFGNGFSIK